MQAVAADKGEEGGQKRAALRARAARDHTGELAELESEEHRPERKGDCSEEINGRSRARIDRERHHPAGVAREKKAGGLDRGGALIEQHRATRTAGSRVHE